MQRYVIAGAAIIGVAALLVMTLSSDKGLKSSVLPLGKPAPEFALPMLRQPDQQLRLSDLAGQIAILNVWATWCVPCRQEHGMLLKIARSGEAPVYGLNYRDDRELAIRWLEQLGDPFVEVGFDPRGEVAHEFGVAAVPETYILDADGVVRYRRLGPITPDVWEQDMLPLLKELRTSNARS